MAGLRVWKRKKDEGTERLLNNYDERYQRLSSSLHDFTGIVDRKGRLQFATESTLVEFGYPEEDILAKPFWDAAWFKHSSESRKAAEQNIRKALAGECVEWEGEIFSRDGTSLLVVFSAGTLTGRDRDIVSVLAEPKLAADQGMLAQAEGESDAKYRSILELMQEVYFQIDKEYKLTQVSPSGAKLLGYASAEQLIGKSIVGFWVNPEEASEFQKALTENGRVDKYEATFQMKDGESKVVELDSHLLFDTKGETIGSVGMIRDISECWHMREKSMPEESTPSLTFTNDVCFAIDNGGCLTSISPAGAEMLGYDLPEELIGHDPAELWEHYEQSHAFLAALTVAGNVNSFEATFRKKDGSYLAVEIDSSLLYEDNGQTIGSKGTFRDMTERKRTEDKLCQSEAEVESMATLIKDLYYHVDNNGIVSSVGLAGAQLMGYDSPEELVGRSENEFWAYPQEMAKYRAQLKKNNGVHEFQATFKANGEEFLVGEVDACFSRDARGEVVGSYIIFRDNTERISQAQEAAEAYAELDRTKTEVEKMAEEKIRWLAESEDRYFSLVERTSDGIMLVQDGVIKFANIVMEHLIKYDRGEVKGMPLVTMLPPNLAESILDGYKQRVAWDEVEDIEQAELIDKYGQTRVVGIKTARVEHDGNPAMLLVVRTVEDNKELEVQKPQDVYVTMVENASDGILLIDENSHVIYANPRLCEMIGCANEDIKTVIEYKGNSASEVIDEIIWRCERQVVREDRQQLGHLEILQKDGIVLPVELSSSQIEYDGGPANLVLIRDISERKQAESVHLEAKKRYQAIFDNRVHMIFVQDERGCLLDVSDFALERLGYTPDDLGHILFQDVIHPEDVTVSLNAMQEAIEEGCMNHPVEIRFLSKSGESIWVECFGLPLVHEGKRFIGMCLAQDITERKQVEEWQRHSVEKLNVPMVSQAQEEWSLPIIQIWDHILALPLIGVIDDLRAKYMMEVLLNKVVETQSEIVILDVAGVTSMDAQVVNHLLKTAKSTSLVGAQCVITGIKPEVAQVMIHLGLDMRMFTTQRDMQAGLKWALKKVGLEHGDRSSFDDESLSPCSWQLSGKRWLKERIGSKDDRSPRADSNTKDREFPGYNHPGHAP